MNIVRPSFDPPVELLEPYFFDFSGDLLMELEEQAVQMDEEEYERMADEFPNTLEKVFRPT